MRAVLRSSSSKPDRLQSNRFPLQVGTIYSLVRFRSSSKFPRPVNKDVPPPCAQGPVSISPERPGNWPAWGALQVGTIYSPCLYYMAHGKDV
jgi:hypothetical protein